MLNCSLICVSGYLFLFSCETYHYLFTASQPKSWKIATSTKNFRRNESKSWSCVRGKKKNSIADVRGDCERFVTRSHWIYIWSFFPSFASLGLPSLSSPLQADFHLNLTSGTYFIYSARSVARIALSIIFRVALYSSRERPLRIWFPWRAGQTAGRSYCIDHRERRSNQLAQRVFGVK